MLTVIVSVKLLPVKRKDSRFFRGDNFFKGKKGERNRKNRERREKKSERERGRKLVRNR